MPNKSLIHIFIIPGFLLMSPSPGFSQPQQENSPLIRNVHAGMNKKAFTKIYPKTKARTYRETSDEEWITFNHPLKGEAHDIITFHIKNNKVNGWQLNNRGEVIDEYLGEFSSMAFKNAFPTIYAAIHDVLERIPYEDFLKISDRRRPILFTEVFDSGTAKFANSSEIISLPDDAPAFQDGLTIIKLSTGLNETQNQHAIEGVLAHEIAHRVLEHVRNGKRTCEAEREANAKIREWGFGKEYDEASQAFGHKAVGEPSPCQDKP